MVGAGADTHRSNVFQNPLFQNMTLREVVCSLRGEVAYADQATRARAPGSLTKYAGAHRSQG